MESCKRKHIKNPIPETDWKCPKCGKDSEHFALWDADASCEKEHPDDYASCTNCGYEATLQTVTKNYWKEKNIKWVKCPHCKGKGVVAEESS